MNLKIHYLNPNCQLTKDAGNSGYDLKANIQSPIVLQPHETKLIPAGILLQIPIGYEGQVRSRSGLSLKNGVIVLNSPGTIDASYRGEVGVILHNTSTEPFTIQPFDRIAQIVFCPIVTVDFVPSTADELEPSKRGVYGFGSTGTGIVI